MTLKITPWEFKNATSPVWMIDPINVALFQTQPPETGLGLRGPHSPAQLRIIFAKDECMLTKYYGLGVLCFMFISFRFCTITTCAGHNSTSLHLQ